MAIRFHEWDVRSMGRVATGVRGIRLRRDDEVVGMVVVHADTNEQTTLLVVTEHGRGKRTLVDDYRLQTRGGQGVINLKLNEQTGKVIAIKGVLDIDELMLITRNGIVNRQRVSGIRTIGRATQGVRLVTLDEGDSLVDVARVVPEDENGVEAGALGEVPVGAEDGDGLASGGDPRSGVGGDARLQADGDDVAVLASEGGLADEPVDEADVAGDADL
jgi:DNA gyrase subunit A